MRKLIAILAFATLAAAFTSAAPAGSASKPGHIVYRLPDGPLLRIEAKRNATPQNMSAVLDRRFPGGDDGYINLSPDGKWIVNRSSRNGCEGNPCVSVFSVDGTVGRKVRGGTVNADGFAAVGNGGNIVVYPERNDDGSREDLKVSRLVGGTWTAPRTITSRSPGPINTSPAISTDGRRVLHDCGRFREPSEGSQSICESRTDGSGTTVRVRAALKRKSAGVQFPSLHHPDYMANGGIVFEANWAPHGESLWFIPPRSKTPRKVRGATGNNVAPCGLPDGHILSLDLTRPGGSGGHELMIASTTQPGRTFVRRPHEDVLDAGLGCGR